VAEGERVSVLIGSGKGCVEVAVKEGILPVEHPSMDARSIMLKI